MKTNKGFTLIELMVASALFIIVMVIAIGAVLSIVDANRKAQTLNSVMTNLNFALESMIRDMREGSNFCPPPSCSSDSITFTNSDDDQVTYYLDSSKHEILKEVVPVVGRSSVTSITAAEVVINNMNFNVKGSNPGDKTQPIILVTINGSAGGSITTGDLGVVGLGGLASNKTKSDFQIQSLITQRLLDH